MLFFYAELINYCSFVAGWPCQRQGNALCSDPKGNYCLFCLFQTSIPNNLCAGDPSLPRVRISAFAAGWNGRKMGLWSGKDWWKWAVGQQSSAWRLCTFSRGHFVLSQEFPALYSPWAQKTQQGKGSSKQLWCPQTSGEKENAHQETWFKWFLHFFPSL